MKKKDKKYFAVRGLFLVKINAENAKDQYSESVILVKAKDEDEAENLGRKLFVDAEDSNEVFLDKVDVTSLWDRPKIGSEIYWFHRISELTPSEYIEKYWSDGKPESCKDKGWKHSWYNYDNQNSCCYNCGEIRKGKLWDD